MPIRHALAAALVLGTPVTAAADLDAALAELANEVLSYVEAGPPKKIAIATMVHGDGTCSDLSERASDKFQGELFRAKANETSVIDRRSLSAIFREQQLVEDGTISPSGAAKIAAVEQVDAIVTGKMTQYGDDLEFVVSMLDAVSGTVVGFADSTFRLSSRDEDMLQTQSLARCGFAPTPAGSESGLTSRSSGQSSGVQQVPGPAVNSGAEFSSSVFNAQIVSLFYAKERGEVTFTLRFINTSDKTIELSFMSESISISNNAGSVFELGKAWSGLRICKDIRFCHAGNAGSVNTLAPGTRAQLTFNAVGPSGLDDLQVTTTFELVVSAEFEDGNARRLVSVGFFDLVPVVR